MHRYENKLLFGDVKKCICILTMLLYFPPSGMEINNFTTITDKTQHLSTEVMFTEIKVISFSRQEQLYLSQTNTSSQ